MPVWDGHLFQIPQWLVFYIGLQSTSRVKQSRCLVVLSPCSWVVQLPYVEVNAQTVSNLSGGDFSTLFPHWVNAAGHNKEKEMWFNGVHKSGFHAAKSKRHMLFRLLLPPLPELVILLNFSVSRAVSCGSWGSWCHPLFHSSLPFGEVSILFHLDSHWLYVSAPPLRPDVSKQIGNGRQGGTWWSVMPCCITPQRAALH